MSLLVIQCLTGLANAMSLFLIASGLSLIFGVTRVVNFAHGSFYMLAAYLMTTLVPALGDGPLAFWGALVLAPLAVAALGGAIEMGLLRRVYRAPELYQLLLTFALVLVLSDAVRFAWGTDNKSGPVPLQLKGAVPILGQEYPTYDLMLIVLGPLVALGLWWLFHRTRWGILIRAATHDREMVGALGVDQRWLFTSVFVLGSWLAGLGGALQVPRQAITNVMDTTIIVEAFVVVVIGGMGSLFGALLSALLIAEMQAFGVLVYPRISQALVFVVMAVVLIVRPWGLLGVPEGPARGPALPVGPGERLEVSPRWGWALAIALLAAPLVLPVFWVVQLTEVFAFALFAASLHLLMGTGGMVSFGHAAYFGLGAYASALLLAKAGVAMPLAFAAAPLVAAAFAALFGVFCVRLAGVYLAMLTLAFSQIAYAVVFQWYDFTGGDNGILGVWPPPSLAPKARFYYLALALAAGGIAVLWRITRAPFGHVLRALRDSPRRAEAIGVNPRAHRLVAFIVAGFFAGIGGAIYVFLKGNAFPDYLSVPMSIEPLVMVLLGGIQSFAGPAVGAVAYKLLDTGITKYTAYWQAVLGGVLVALVIAFPYGIVGYLQARWWRFARRIEARKG